MQTSFEKGDSMKQYLISGDMPQYRANLHSHSTLSDGNLTPEELRALYQSNGYSILAITDHELPKNHSHMSDKDFLMLTGYEAYVRPNPNYIFDPYEVEAHLNFFAKDPNNETVICYNPASNKFFAKNHIDPDRMHRAGSEREREYSVEYLNEFIRTAVENGYLVSYNHPTWSMEDEERIFAYENIFSLEIDNFCSYQSNAIEHAGALYDKMLRRRKKIFCHAGDDNHNSHSLGSPKCDSFGAWTMILAKELTYASVIEAMECGNMYASTGPRINEISIEDGKVHVESSPARQIILFSGSKAPQSIIAEEGESLTSADLKLDKIAPYFRISVVDERGHRASSRGFFRSEYIH